MSGSRNQLTTPTRLPAPACLQRLLLAGPLLVAWATPAAAQDPGGKAWSDLATAQTDANRQAGARQVPAHVLPVPKMYPLGFLFGPGFDTATEVGLLGISATQASQGMSPRQAMVFPALFTAGMAMMNTADSVLMIGAYGWAFVNPLRKLWYNLTITAASVLVALLIGGVEALGLLGDQLALTGPFWDAVGSLNDSFGYLGFAVVGIFVLCWAASTTIYRWQGYRWQGYDRLDASKPG